MYQLIVQMIFMTASYYFFEMFVERKLRIREKTIRKIRKVYDLGNWNRSNYWDCVFSFILIRI